MKHSQLPGITKMCTIFTYHIKLLVHHGCKFIHTQALCVAICSSMLVKAALYICDCFDDR